MSCMQISMKAIASVRDTIIASYYRGDNLYFNLLGFFGTEEDVKSYAKRFAEDIYIFNDIERGKSELAKRNEKPDYWQLYLDALNEHHGNRLEDVQLFKTLMCIEYNTDVVCNLTSKEYLDWELKNEYELFTGWLKKLMSSLAVRIICEMPEFKKAQWDY